MAIHSIGRFQTMTNPGPLWVIRIEISLKEFMVLVVRHNKRRWVQEDRMSSTLLVLWKENSAGILPTD